LLLRIVTPAFTDFNIINRTSCAARLLVRPGARNQVLWEEYMKPMRIALLGSAISLAAVASAAPASAALIENWIVSINNSWSDVQFASSGPASIAPQDPFGVFDTLPDGSDPRGLDYDVISWGTPRTDMGRSFLAVDETVSLAATTNDPIGVIGTSLYHGNYVQAASTSENPAERWLDSAVLNLEITLAPADDATRTT